MSSALQDGSRPKRLRALMNSLGCSHLFLTDSTDIMQLCGFRSSHVFVLVSATRLFLFTDFRYRSAAVRFVATNPLYTFIEIASKPFEIVASKVRPGSRVAYQSALMPVDTMRKLRSALKGSVLVGLGEALGDITCAKNTLEIQAMSRAARIGDKALAATLPFVKIGVSEKEVAMRLEEQCRLFGSQGPSFETIVLFGSRSALPHGVPGPTRLRAGDFVLVDFGCMVKGVCSDMTRTFVAGRASARQRHIYETVRVNQEIGRSGVRAGLAACAADALVRAGIEQQGFGEAFGHATGHGVGYRIHESPRLAASEKRPLPAHAVVTVEPGIYIEGFGGVRIEDMVYLHPQRPRVLTQFGRELRELEV